MRGHRPRRVATSTDTQTAMTALGCFLFLIVAAFIGIIATHTPLWKAPPQSQTQASQFVPSSELTGKPSTNNTVVIVSKPPFETGEGKP